MLLNPYEVIGIIPLLIPMEINENEIYTASDVQKILKLSESTTMRFLKQGLIKAAKVGKQYRVMGKELFRLVSPKLEDKAGIMYNKARRWIHDETPFKLKKDRNVKNK